MVGSVTANWPTIRDTLIEAFRRVRAVVIPIVQKVAAFIRNTLVPAFEKVAVAVRKVAAAISLMADVGSVAVRAFSPLIAALKQVVPVVAVIVSKFVELVGPGPQPRTSW